MSAFDEKDDDGPRRLLEFPLPAFCSQVAVRATDEGLSVELRVGDEWPEAAEWRELANLFQQLSRACALEATPKPKLEPVK